MPQFCLISTNNFLQVFVGLYMYMCYRCTCFSLVIIIKDCLITLVYNVESLTNAIPLTKSQLLAIASLNLPL